ncbi:TRAP transporter large permease [Phreatobacter stygius]|uniref:TRAP transporter large permease protein n=1 Tax=Phreatobacter stygius TaxID=1940610 RepID=A0A4D7AYJ9_9HYPH|nr:TRAP transporter large permease [Phreatobacter stygius]QCI65351.1 TRAP transporter large permease [Phreatobacter stygius]
MMALALPAVILGLLVLRQNVILTVAAAVAFVHAFLARGSSVEYLVQDLWFTVDREVLLSIPMFMFAGVLMSRGSIVGRLVRVMVALTSWIPGGLGVATVLAMAAFSAISGSSVVTMLAIGTLMYPALLANGYGKNYSLGVLCAGGTLGIIIPPSILMVLYGITTNVSITDLFKAGWGPGLLLTGALCLYTVVIGWRRETTPFDWRELLTATRTGVTAILMPVILLGGIYTGRFTVTESAALSVVYALLVELAIHREVRLGDIRDIAVETVKLLGNMLPLLAVAGSLNVILDYEGVPKALVDMAQTVVHDRWAMILAINVLLLIAGAMMDEGSAIVIFAPLIAPLGAAYGFDPVHFAIIVIVNLQVGYVAPPVAINLIVATAAFKESFGLICRSVMPFVAIMLAVLAVTVLVPGLSLVFVK